MNWGSSQKDLPIYRAPDRQNLWPVLCHIHVVLLIPIQNVLWDLEDPHSFFPHSYNNSSGPQNGAYS